MTKKEREALLKKSEVPVGPVMEVDKLELSEQSMKQKKIALAQSVHAPIVIELLKDCMNRTALVGDNEFKTIVNAVTFDVQSEILIKMVDLLENIRQGKMHEQK